MLARSRSKLSSGLLVAGALSLFACGTSSEGLEQSDVEPLSPSSDPSESVVAPEEAQASSTEGAGDTESAADQVEQGPDPEEAGMGAAEGTGDDPPDAPMTDTPEPLVVFVTSTRQPADFGGLEGADDLCSATAAAASLDGTFKAWLSTADEPVFNRLRQVAVPYVRTDGVRVADDWNDLVDGTLQVPISRDESGAAASGDVWTGTLSDGNPLLTDDCDGFTSGGGGGRAQCGNAGAASTAWTQNLVPSCSVALRLYCFEQ